MSVSARASRTRRIDGIEKETDEDDNRSSLLVGRRTSVWRKSVVDGNLKKRDETWSMDEDEKRHFGEQDETYV